MIEPVKFHDRIFISSVDLHNALGKPFKKYYKLVRYIKRNGSLQENRDYVVNKKYGHGRPVIAIYMSLSLAKSICIKEGTVVSKNLRFYIEENIELKISKFMG